MDLRTIVLLVSLIMKASAVAQVTFWEHNSKTTPGQMETFNLEEDACYNLKRSSGFDWSGKPSYVINNGNCLFLFKGPDCTGENFLLQPVTKEIDLVKVNWNDVVVSFGLCLKSA